MTLRRQFGFRGSDVEYIAFLESKVLESSRIIESYVLSSKPNQSRGLSTTTVPRASLQKNSFSSSSEDEGYESGSLQIIEYTPNVPSLPPNQNAASSTKPRWLKELDEFLTQIPQLGSWDRGRLEYTVNNDIILKIIVSCEPLPSGYFLGLRPYSVQAPNQRGILSVLQKYCKFTQNIQTQVKMCERVAQFLELVFVSLCAVALKAVEDVDPVYNIMRTYVSNAKRKHLDNLIRGATWANHCVSALYKTPWGYRGQEVFLIAGQPIAFYARYAENCKSLPHFIKEMNRKAEGRHISGPRTSASILSIPLILEKLIGGAVSLSDICEYLGYQSDHVSSCRPLFERSLMASTSATSTLQDSITSPRIPPSSVNFESQFINCTSSVNPRCGATLDQVLDHDHSTNHHQHCSSSRGSKRRRSESPCNVSDIDAAEYTPSHHQIKTAVPLNDGRRMQDSGNLLANQCAHVVLEDSSRNNEGPDHNSDIGQQECNYISTNVSHGPRPGEPGCSITCDNHAVLLENSSNAVPYGPHPSDPGSLAIDVCLDGLHPNTSPYAPLPNDPESWAVNNYPILLQSSSNAVPCGPQLNDPGSLAAEDCLNGLLSTAFPYGPLPSDPESWAVNNYPILLQRSSNAVPYGPHPSDSGSLAIDVCLDGLHPITFPYGPLPNDPGALAVHISAPVPLQDSTATVPCGSRPEDPESLGTADSHSNQPLNIPNTLLWEQRNH
ncbi:hypothetical protein BDV26DRAFT_292878 [Aspergillus bertholletiae]|uniref:Uncharacterized protein n=1 Tax=Aspergillus bertholletiae TaxID=1226010 RepID=A0A5N7B7P8_9EURO|nr:hypothetical protein BDV26DRAFT_292878 [Aspergillus bertholletiae]